MRQDFLFLADKAEAINGKLYVIGGGANVHRAASFPVNLLADIAASFLVDWGEINEPIDVVLDIVDEDEKPVRSYVIEAVVGRSPHAKPGQSLRNILTLRGPFTIAKPGQYKLTMKLDGTPQDPPFRFWVEQVPARAQRSAPPAR